MDDIDWILSRRLRLRRPKLDLQVKSWTRDTGTPEAIHYPWQRKNDDGFILTNLLIPRFLILVRVPRQPEAWL